LTDIDPRSGPGVERFMMFLDDRPAKPFDARMAQVTCANRAEPVPESTSRIRPTGRRGC
jgi:hypothetical protein